MTYPSFVWGLLFLLLLLVSNEGLVHYEADLQNLSPRYCGKSCPGLGIAGDNNVDPDFPVQGSVTSLFLRSNTTGKIANCVRVIGGKNMRHASEIQQFVVYLKQRLTFNDVLYCLHNGSLTGGSDLYSHIMWGISYLHPEMAGPFNNFLNAIPDAKVGYLPKNGDDYPLSSTVSQSYVYRDIVNQSNLAFHVSRATFAEVTWPTHGENLELQGTSTSAYAPWNFRFDRLDGRCAFTFYTPGKPPSSVSSGFALYSGLTGLESTCGTLEKDYFGTYQNCPGMGDMCNLSKEIYLRFRARCFIGDDRYTVQCLDPSKYGKYSSISDAGTALFTGIEVSSVQNIDPDLLTHGHLRYLSWGLDFLNMLHMNDRYTDAMRASLGITTPRTDSFQTAVSFFPLPRSEVKDDIIRKRVDGNRFFETKQPSDLQQLFPILNATRLPDFRTNLFFMECPRFNNKTCNSDPLTNLNVCNEWIGRCLCDDKHAGIACQFDVTGRNWWELTADPSDPYQICSTAGYLDRSATIGVPIANDNVLGVTVPVCSCLDGWGGTPERWKSWVPVYASLFHVALVSTIASRKGFSPADYVLDEWFTPFTSPYFDNNINLSNKKRVDNNWFASVFKHQCYIWLRPPHEMPREYLWDYVTHMGSLSDWNDYEEKRQIYPWPALSFVDRHGQQTGLQPMDLKRFDWASMAVTSLVTEPFTADAMVRLATFMTQKIIPQYPAGVTLYGGKYFTPCPDCNREHSTCKSSSNNNTYCACDDNWTGELCNTQICPTSSIYENRVCAGHGSCTGSACQCITGWSGPACDVPLCPLRNGLLCGGQGQCSGSACICDDGRGGASCDRAACPKNQAGLECSGATDQFGDSVCNPSTLLCECTRTLYPSSAKVTLPGWPASYNGGGADLSVYTNGRWGSACEFTYADVCKDPRDTKSWCGYNLDANTAGPGYAGCFFEGTCLPGQVCKPQCHCTLEFYRSNGTYCDTSVCGPDECGTGGTCQITCTKGIEDKPQCITSLLNDPASGLTAKAKCQCGVVGTTYMYHRDPDDDSTEPCNDPAPLCYTGATNSPCNKNGQCAYNATSRTHYCLCNPGYSGPTCAIPPLCTTPLGAACDGPNQQCVPQGSGYLCTCKPAFQRTGDRLCTNERCVSTGGTVNPNDGSCQCPSNHYYSNPPLERHELDQTQLGCRKGCPISNANGYPCGATTGTRCSDLIAGDPIFGDDPRPPPTCNCGFLGADGLGNTNYFITDATGSCSPKCVPAGLCQPGSCPITAQYGTLTSSFDCVCGHSYTGTFCESHRCSGQGTVTSPISACTCSRWCLGGPSCSTDLCNGGTCPASGDNCDCSASAVLKLSPTGNCTSACVNGGVLSSNRRSCICPSGFRGQLCELSSACRAQFTGPSCNISACANGGTPLTANGAVGCSCPSFYSGLLCSTDTCVGPTLQRVNSSYCGCKPGYSGVDCTQTSCAPGGVPSLNGSVCLCSPGYVLAPNQTACLPRDLPPSCVNGTLSLVTRQCECFVGFQGANCSEPLCQPPFVATPLETCVCPTGLYGTMCQETHCNSDSVGASFDPKTNTVTCVCRHEDYAPSIEPDSSGTRQCVHNPFYCDPTGTQNWSPTTPNPVPCICNAGYTGDRCDQTQTSEAAAQENKVIFGLTSRQTAIVVLSALVGGALAFIVWQVRRTSGAVVVATKFGHKHTVHYE